MGIGDRLYHAWNAFKNKPNDLEYSMHRQTVPSVTRTSTYEKSDRSIIQGIRNRMSIDLAHIDYIHARVDDNGRYVDRIRSGLNNCLQIETNIDQTAFAFKQELAYTLLEKGVACIVPTDTDISPIKNGGYDIKKMRVGTIQTWYTTHVEVSLYNEETGMRDRAVLPKKTVAIIENPLYSVMNASNSALSRLSKKISILDKLDDDLVNNKLDMIIQLPYVVKSDVRKSQAEKRLGDIEHQMTNSKYGIAYVDSTEKITQLNRPLENNVLPTIDFLSKQVYSQLGLTDEIMNGTANEQAMVNYYRRTIEPIARVICEEMTRTFLTKTARTQNQRVIYLRSMFELITTDKLGDLADKLTRNEVLTSNELRAIAGFKPSDDPGADELRNSNMPVQDTPFADEDYPEEYPEEEYPEDEYES